MVFPWVNPLLPWKKIESGDAVAETFEHECMFAACHMPGFTDITKEIIEFSWNSDGEEGGEIDGYLVGKYLDRPVVIFVICEEVIMHNEDVAVEKVFQHNSRWIAMKEAYGDGNPIDEDLRHAYATLSFKKYASYDVMFVIGSTLWSDYSERIITKALVRYKLPVPWFKIVVTVEGSSISLIKPANRPGGDKEITEEIPTEEPRPERCVSKFIFFFALFASCFGIFAWKNRSK